MIVVVVVEATVVVFVVTGARKASISQIEAPYIPLLSETSLRNLAP